MTLLMLGAIVDATGSGGSVNVTTILLGLLNVFLTALTGAGVLIRKRYEIELAEKNDRLQKYEAADELRRQAADRAMATLEQAVAIAKSQNDTINTVVDKQGALLATIAARQDEAKDVAARRTRTP